MREYETLYLLTPDAVPQKTEDLGQKLTQAINNHSGHLLTLFNWGKRRVAYPVSKHSSGIYLYLNYLSSDGGVVNEIERILRNDDTVLKFITVKLDEDVNTEERLKIKREFILSSIDEEFQGRGNERTEGYPDRHSERTPERERASE